MLERMQPIAEALIEPEIVFSFPAGSVPAPPLVTMEGGRVGYGDKVVLDRLSLRIDPDDRIALLGANGNGKSTFAKLVAGRLEPMEGELTRARGLEVGFFAQHQIEDLDPAETAAPASCAACCRRSASSSSARRLARFGLGQHKAETPAGQLSGGEKARLCFALMCVNAPQLLILDEPTNHLDIDSRQALVEAVNEFPGAVIVISHDRHLVELAADRLWLVADGRVRPRRAISTTIAGCCSRPRPSRPAPEPARPDRLPAGERRALLAPLRQRVKEAERQIERLDQERANLEARLADPASYASGTDMARCRSASPSSRPRLRPPSTSGWKPEPRSSR